MSAAPMSATDSIQENSAGSDSDSNPDDSPDYYQPISAVEAEEFEDHSDCEDRTNSDEEHHNNGIRNGYCNQMENGFSSLHGLNLNEDLSEEEKEDQTTDASELAVRRAFVEDESRRNAPLTPENATRVMEAMRGISFAGSAPDWANQVPENRWMDQLRRLRDPN